MRGKKATWVALLLLLAGAGAPSEAADSPEAPPARIGLAGARVLATPNFVPKGFVPFLPGGQRVEPLSWPLPDGPLLLLGGTRDPLARGIGEALGILPDGEDLRGGYVAAAWLDGTRSIGAVLADDAAALMAARFELELVPPVGRERRPRSLDFRAPPEEGELSMKAGVRRVRPRYRTRALYLDAAPDQAVLAARAGRANQVWFGPVEAVAPPPDSPPAEGSLASALRAARHEGIEPVLLFRVGALEELLSRMRSWKQGHGVERFALAFPEQDIAPGEASALVNEVLRRMGGSFRRTDLVVVPPASGVVPLGEIARPHGTWLAWWGPADGVAEVSGEDARRAQQAAGAPLLFVETWGLPSARSLFERRPFPLRLASRPRGRSQDLGDVVEGVLALGDPAAAALVLEDAWEGVEGPDEWEAVLLPLLPAHAGSAGRFLALSAERLRAADRRAFRAVPWMAPLADGLDALARGLSEDALEAPLVPAGVRVDGRLDEPAWAYAGSRALSDGGDGAAGRLLALSDGSRLALALRVLGTEEVVLQVSTGQAGAESTVRVVGGQTFTATPHGAGGLEVAVRREGGVTTLEVLLDRFALGGDAYPTRSFAVSVTRALSNRQRVLFLGDLVVVR